MTHLTDVIMAAAIGNLEDVFDSHAMIQQIMTNHPHEYIHELYGNITASDPITITDAVIGKSLHRVPGITTHGRVKSPNIRGQITDNQRWRKILPGETPQEPAQE